MASLFKTMTLERISLDDALELLSLPRVVGVDPTDGVEITAQNGKFGPYLQKLTARRQEGQPQPLHRGAAADGQPRPTPRRSSPSPRCGAARWPSRRSASSGVDPVSGKPMVLKDGRFGPYVTDGETNASLRKADDVETITDERASELLQDRRDRGPAPKKAAKKAAKKSTKKTAKKATAKKAAAKKAPAKKAAAKARPPTSRHRPRRRPVRSTSRSERRPVRRRHPPSGPGSGRSTHREAQRRSLTALSSRTVAVLRPERTWDEDPERRGPASEVFEVILAFERDREADGDAGEEAVVDLRDGSGPGERHDDPGESRADGRVRRSGPASRPRRCTHAVRWTGGRPASRWSPRNGRAGTSGCSARSEFFRLWLVQVVSATGRLARLLGHHPAGRRHRWSRGRCRRRRDQPGHGGPHRPRLLLRTAGRRAGRPVGPQEGDDRLRPRVGPR